MKYKIRLEESEEGFAVWVSGLPRVLVTGGDGRRSD